MKRPVGTAFLVAPILLYVGLFALLPAGILFAGSVAAAGGPSAVAAAVATPLNRQAIGNSLLQGGLSSLLAVGVGYPAGLFLGRYDWRGREIVRSVLLVPFLLPSLVVVLAVRDLFGSGGLLSGPLPLLGALGSGVPAIVAVNLVFNLPLVILLTASGAAVAPRALEETVVTLGGSPARAYRDAWGPSTWIGAAAGGLLTFLFSALSFAPPLLLCGPRCYTVEARVWSLDTTFLDPSGAGVLALVLLAAFAVPAIAYLELARRLRSGGSLPSPGPPRRPRGAIAAALAAETALVVAAVGLVLGAIVDRTVAPYGGAGVGAAWTALLSPATARAVPIGIPGALGNTLLFAAVAAGLAVLLTVPASLAVAGGRRGGTLLGFFLFAPLLVSPVVLAFALANFWRPLFGGEATVWVLVIVSQGMLALPFALQALGLPLSGLGSGPREAAETLGAPRFFAFLDADLPRLRDGLVTAGLFAFALGLGEFTATNFLVTPRFTTLPVALYGLADSRHLLAADGAAGLLLLVSLAVFLAISVGGRRVEL